MERSAGKLQVSAGNSLKAPMIKLKLKTARSPHALNFNGKKWGERRRERAKIAKHRM